MRIFIALNMPSELIRLITAQIQPLQEKYPEFRWIREENLHITLAFLGELEEPGVAALHTILHSLVPSMNPIFISTEKIFTLPRGKPGNVLALGIEKGKEAVAALSAGFELRLIQEGNQNFRPPETRAFIPHITIARRGSVPIKVCPEDRQTPIHAQGTLETLGIFKSDLSPQGIRYTPLFEYPLKSGGA